MVNKRHREPIKLITENSTFVSVSQTTDVDEQQRSIVHTVSTTTFSHPTKIISFQDQVTRGEAMWAINAASHGYSCKSYDEADDLFRTMFPDSEIAEQFSMERTKCRTLFATA